MSTQQHEQWIVDWFGKRDIQAENREQNYFDLGYLDSFGVIELIEDVETQYQVRLGDEQFRDRRFSTIVGLASIIEEISNG